MPHLRSWGDPLEPTGRILVPKAWRCPSPCTDPRVQAQETLARGAGCPQFPLSFSPARAQTPALTLQKQQIFPENLKRLQGLLTRLLPWCLAHQGRASPTREPRSGCPSVSLLEAALGGPTPRPHPPFPRTPPGQRGALPCPADS